MTAYADIRLMVEDQARDGFVDLAHIAREVGHDAHLFGGWEYAEIVDSETDAGDFE